MEDKPWTDGYRKPNVALGDKRRNQCAATKYADLPEDEKEKDRTIARYIINSHLDYQQFVNSFTPHKLEELENRTLVFSPPSDPLSIQPTIIINATDRQVLKKTIDSYKTITGNTHIYDFGTKGNKQLYLGPGSQVALTAKYRDRRAGSRGVVVAIEEIDGEELPLIRFLDGEELYIGYVDGDLPLMMAHSDVKFELEMCLIDGKLIGIDDMKRALEKARTFDCVKLKNMSSIHRV